MPNARTANAVRLEFAPDSLAQSNLSGAAFTGDRLWVAGDEACGLDRLRLLDLPGAAGEEADLEGVAVADGFLWVVGSHGLKRKNAKPDRGHADNAKRLAKVALDGRRLLLEIAVEGRGDQLRLAPLDDSGTPVRKHFLQLDGLGVRDLHFSGDDLYILAGPTMVLNGDIRVFKWPAARPLLAVNREPVRFESALTESVPLPHGRGTNRAEAICDLPPALSGGKARWLVLYDLPGADRKEDEHTVFGDLLRHD